MTDVYVYTCISEYNTHLTTCMRANLTYIYLPSDIVKGSVKHSSYDGVCLVLTCKGYARNSGGQPCNYFYAIA